MSESNSTESSGVGPKLVLMLLANSKELCAAHERLPADAEQLYQQAVVALQEEIMRMSSAHGLQEARRHKDNIAHIKATLDSLDAVVEIKLYRATVQTLQKVAVIAFKVALTLV